VTRKNYGEWFGVRHKMFDEMPPEERNRFYQEMVAEIAQAAVADSNLVTNFDSYPGTESYSVQVQKYAVRDGDYLYFELPRSLSHPFGLRSDTHENPYYQSADQSLRITTIVELPKGFSHVVLAPGQKEWKLPANGGTARVRVVAQPRGEGVPPSNRGQDARDTMTSPTILTFTHEVDLNPFILDSASYGDLLEIEKQLTHAEARTVLVSQKK
jgi:hypothetical protein